jgi:hypothetical protein
LDGGVDFRGTQKEFFGSLGIRGSFLPVLQEFYEYDHVLGLQMHVESIYSLFANKKWHVERRVSGELIRQTAHVPGQLRNGFQVYEYAVYQDLARSQTCMSFLTIVSDAGE